MKRVDKPMDDFQDADGPMTVKWLNSDHNFLESLRRALNANADEAEAKFDDIDDSLYCHDNRIGALEKLYARVDAIENQHIWHDGAIVGHLGFVPIDTPPLGSDNSLDAYVEGRMATDKPDTQELKPSIEADLRTEIEELRENCDSLNTSCDAYEAENATLKTDLAKAQAKIERYEEALEKAHDWSVDVVEILDALSD